jgi:hypothetical protein
MSYLRNRSPWVWLGVGLLAGLVLGGLWPNTPLRAVATDRTDTFAMATGPVDEEVEAVYFLDFYTGELRAAVLSKQKGTFQAVFSHNVNADLAVDPAKNPKYLMVTGVADLRRMGGGRAPLSKSVLYVAEITSGKVAAYVVPWVPAMHGAAQVFQGQMQLLTVGKFRTVAAGGGTPGIGTRGKAGT